MLEVSQACSFSRNRGEGVGLGRRICELSRFAFHKLNNWRASPAISYLSTAPLLEFLRQVLSDYYRHTRNLRDLPQADLVISPRLGFYVSFSREV